MANNYRVALFGLGKIAYAHMHGYLAPENADRTEVVAGAAQVRKPDRHSSRSINDKVLRRNALAEEIMQEYHIPISDLYQLVLNKAELRGADGYHYNADGQRVQGEAISELLLQFLK